MQFTNEKANKDLAEIGRMLREELWLIGVFIFVFEVVFPIDAFVFATTILDSLCVFRDIEMVGVWEGAVVACMACVGTMVIGTLPFRLWGWRKKRGQMVHIWKQNMKTSFMPVGDVPFKRKVNICLVWFYIMLRMLCIVAYVMTPASGVIALVLRDEFLPETGFVRLFPLIPHVSPTCAIVLFIVATMLFYLAVHVPQCPKDAQKAR